MRGRTIVDTMIVDIARRLTGAALAVSMIFMALAACTSGAMTTAAMVCCADHHDECEMAGQAESCCAPDLQSDLGVLAPERSDTFPVTLIVSQVAVTLTDGSTALSQLAASSSARTPVAFHHPKPRLHLLNTVLLI